MEFSPALLPRGYRTGSPPSHPAGRNGRSSIRKRLHPNDECAGGQHLAPECGCEELAPARLRATVDDGPAQPRARRANLATATVSDSEEEDSDSRGSRISTFEHSIETASSSSETRASSTPRAPASAAPRTELQSPKGRCSLPCAGLANYFASRSRDTAPISDKTVNVSKTCHTSTARPSWKR
jgi:hypothetical protein